MDLGHNLKRAERGLVGINTDKGIAYLSELREKDTTEYYVLEQSESGVTLRVATQNEIKQASVYKK